MSLYRTYRPQNFADVVGQEHIVTTLENAAKQGQLSHAYLFAGSRGTGKTSVARILAKHVLTQGITDDLLRNHLLTAVEEGSLVDLLEIDAASNRGIDDVRDLISKIAFPPSVATAKVYIIDEVHMLTKEAFNALLKTLEEPPPYAYFILATTELHKVPVTIQSRCQCFPFRRIREDDIIRRLQYIADQEKIEIDRDALRVIARHVEGGLRDAVSLLDQLRSLEHAVTPDDVEARIGSTGDTHAEAILAAVNTGDAAGILEHVRALEESGASLEHVLRQLLTRVRAMLRSDIESGADGAREQMLLDGLLQTVRDVRQSPVPGLAFEAGLLRLLNREERATSSFFGGLFGGKARTAEPAPAPVAAAPAETPEPTVDVKSALVEAPELSLESLQSQWDAIVAQTTPASVKMSLKSGQLSKLEGAKVVVAFSTEFHRDTVAKTEASRKVEEVMERIFKRNLRLACVLQSESQIAAAVSTQDDSINLADAAAEIFS